MGWGLIGRGALGDVCLISRVVRTNRNFLLSREVLDTRKEACRRIVFVVSNQVQQRPGCVVKVVYLRKATRGRTLRGMNQEDFQGEALPLASEPVHPALPKRAAAKEQGACPLVQAFARKHVLLILAHARQIEARDEGETTRTSSRPYSSHHAQPWIAYIRLL